MSPHQLLFTYGTLMRGEPNQAQMLGATYLAHARTMPGWTLYSLDGYPGLVRGDADQYVDGEVWSVPPQVLLRLDEFEGVEEGLYTRERILLEGSWAASDVHVYRYLRPVKGCRWIGSSWRAAKAAAS